MNEETESRDDDGVLDLMVPFELAQGITGDARAAAMLVIAKQIAGLEDGLLKLRQVLDRRSDGE